MPAPIPPSVFVSKLTERGVTIYADGDELRLKGPKSERTPKVLAYAKQRKPELLALLKASEAPPPSLLPVSGEVAAAAADPDAELRALMEGPGQVEIDDWFAESMRELYALACAGKLPREQVRLAPGAVVTDPNQAVLYLVETCRKLRAKHGPDYWKTGRGQEADSGLETLLLWWKDWPGTDLTGESDSLFAGEE